MEKSATTELQGEWLCLEYTNTVSWHASDHPEEHLENYASLVHWAQAQGLLSGAEAARLLQGDPQAQEAVYRQAIELREALYRILGSAAHGRPARPTDLQILNRQLADAGRQARLEPDGEGYRWGWAPAPGVLEQILWPIARSAAELLTGPERQRVGQCADEQGCGWLFVDTSKNHSRRWCAMGDCGNRAKARRHYRRVTGLTG